MLSWYYTKCGSEKEVWTVGTYTELMEDRSREIDMDDDNYLDELLDVASRFRCFDEALDEFLQNHGYNGALSDVEGKVSFLRQKLKQAGVPKYPQRTACTRQGVLSVQAAPHPRPFGPAAARRRGGGYLCRAEGEISRRVSGGERAVRHRWHYQFREQYD